MISAVQSKNISYLYQTFLDSEIKGWQNIDNFLELLAFLDDDQLYREADVLYTYHKNQKVGCPYDHADSTVCLVPRIIEAVEAIIDLYQEVGNLHPRNRYILEYYIALCQDQQILLLDS